MSITSPHSSAMQIREAAERVLFSTSLEEKLVLSPENLSDDAPGAAISHPDAPARPHELEVTAKGVRAEFPGVNKLDDDAERGKMLHFLANHELLAAELMALVLLKFPNAPREYRRGVYEAMREEQMHTRMYLRRMRDCGINFGELPVNDYFWRLIAPMETPLDFVTRLNLTFEQANLDFSKHYAGLFRQAGDAGTAAVLEKIYLDEIGHVGHGVKWFRKWKQQGESDWLAFKTSLTFPLAPAKAKGMAPFNAEGRRLAGLDDDFISQLEVCEQSRGRTPVVHWFNPNAESHAAAAAVGASYTPSKMELTMEQDLELLTLAWCRRDDMALLRERPDNAHLAQLLRAGLNLPEIVTQGELSGQSERKLGGIRPWAWSPEASQMLEPFSCQVSPSIPQPWRKPIPNLWLSKGSGVQLQQMLDLPETAIHCSDLDATIRKTESLLATGEVLLKADFSCAGRGHRRVTSLDEATRSWIKNTLQQHGGVVIEPWHDRCFDFSSLYEMKSGDCQFLAVTRMENDARGRYLGTRIDSKWGSGMDAEQREFFFRRSGAPAFYRDTLPAALREMLPGYTGPVGIDAMIYRHADGSLALRHIIELNVRMTMGRIAYELHRKLTPSGSGRFSILRKRQLSKEQLSALYSQATNTHIAINDPSKAKEFIAVWQECE
ncbi:MAG: DUF455 family protein [Akkermansiaceae bacterium]